MQLLMSRLSTDKTTSNDDPENQTSNLILELIGDYDAIGYKPGTAEYASLVQALSHEVGREKDALQLLDDIVNSSEIGPFVRVSRRRSSKSIPIHQRILTDAEIERIDKSLLEADRQQHQTQQHYKDDKDDSISAADISDLSDSRDPDRVQQLVLERRRQRQQQQQLKSNQRGNALLVSRLLYHAAMNGFAQIYHVRGVVDVLGRMLETATCVPFRIARHMMPNNDTWDIVGKVLVRQRDRPTFVKIWIEFMSRGARPPASLSRSLVQMLVRQSCLEQAVWVMRISRCLPDVGDRLPMSSHAEDRVPWDLKVQTMYVASALDAATSLDSTLMTREDAMIQGKAAAQLPLLAPPDADMYSYLIGGAVRAKNTKLAEHLFGELVDAGAAPDGATYGHLAAMYANKGQIERVFIIARDMMVRRYQLLARESVQQGRSMTPAALDALKLKIHRHALRLQADIECIAPLLQLYVQGNREKEALLLLRSWNRIYQQHVPAEKLALALLRVYKSPEDSASVDGLLPRLVRKLEEDQPHHGQERGHGQGGEQAALTMQPAAGADAARLLGMYMETIKTHIRAHNLPGIISALREIEGHGLQPSHAIWDMAMRGFLREQALDLFDTTHAYLRNTLSMPLSLPLYSMWMRSLRNHGDVAGVQSAFDELLELGQIPTQQHYLYLVQTYAYNGWIERAMSIIDGLRRPQSQLRPGLNLNIAAIEAQVACGNLDRAEAELRYLLDTTPLPKSSIPARPFNYLIIGYLYSGNGRSAMSVYEKMLRLGVKPDTYTFAILMHSYSLAKDLDNCMRVFNEMIRIGVSPDLVVYTILISTFGAARKAGSAELVFNQVAQEQDMSRSQMGSSNPNSPFASAPGAAIAEDALDIYAEDPGRENWSALLSTASNTSAGSGSLPEQMRVQSFFNLDPIIYIAMLKVYQRVQRPMKALATWDRLIKNFPVVQWNSREGGVMSKTLHFTAQFHLPAWTLLLQTVRHSIGVPRVLTRSYLMMNYFVAPIYPPVMSDVLLKRRGIKEYIRGFDGKGSEDTAIRAFSRNMVMRAQLVDVVEAELDENIAVDHKFCVRQRHLQPRPVFYPEEAFSDYDYWAPHGASLSQDMPISAPDDGAASSKQPTSDPDTELFDSDGQFITSTAQEIAANVSQRWYDLEKSGFKFNNIHVAIYLPCMLLGRQYAELARFLSVVQPQSSEIDESSPENVNYRYCNIAIPPYVTAMLVRQIKVLRRQLLVDRDKRIILDALLSRDSSLHQEYRKSTRGKSVDAKRSEDVMQVMRERQSIHAERELAWSDEIAMIKKVALVWLSHASGAEEARFIRRAIEDVDRLL
ncbi:hypothetical protein LPJ53_002612 [Coemansia erecta]|uniref:Pentacotripeptide-repeat region of PRORP domain-containing protein n=1 Tax=Coemansia erecta TaxID=147472 RepID=A0A9W8CRP8_9FUNG|nr:hypothetical protein LPJ53_002612 [Coemansia erecta]